MSQKHTHANRETTLLHLRPATQEKSGIFSDQNLGTRFFLYSEGAFLYFFKNVFFAERNFDVNEKNSKNSG